MTALTRPIDTPDYSEPEQTEWALGWTVWFCIGCSVALWAGIIAIVLDATGVFHS